ncbi:hypothetical protein INR49_005444 [Caranx melampygus]|nr:hypothetical protein INR49_005444 [Caranx melampygus]
MREYKVVVLGSGGVGKSALTVQFVTGTFIEKYDPTIEDFYRKEIEVDSSPSVLEILDTAGTEQFASMRDLYIKNGQGFILVYSLVNQQSFQDIKPMRDQIIRVKSSQTAPEPRTAVAASPACLSVLAAKTLVTRHDHIGVRSAEFSPLSKLETLLKRAFGRRPSSQPVFSLILTVLAGVKSRDSWAARFHRPSARPMYEKVPVILVGNKVDLESEREVSSSEGQALAEEWGCPFMETSAKSKTMVDELFAEIVRQMDYAAQPDKDDPCCSSCNIQ